MNINDIAQNDDATNSCFSRIKKYAIDVLKTDYVKQMLDFIMFNIQFFVISFAINFVYYYDSRVTFKEHFHETFNIATKSTCYTSAFNFCVGYPLHAIVVVFFVILYECFTLKL